jgi:molybdopterin molybdotransferase
MPVALGTRDGRATVRPATAGGAASHLAGGLAAADGFAIVPEHVQDVEAGGLVEVAVLW